MNTKDIDKASSGIGVRELRVVNDVELELGLHRLPGALTTMSFIADQGGEVPWSDSAAHPNTLAVIEKVIALGLLEKIDRAIQHPHGRVYLRLTDKGRNVVAIHRNRKVEIGGMRDVSIEEARAIATSPVVDGSAGPSTTKPGA